MKRGDVQIEVISKITGDPENLVREVVNLLRKVFEEHADKALDEELSPDEEKEFRRQLMDDGTLINWYKQGLRHRTFLNQ